MVQRVGWVKQFLREDDGLTSIEYALILMLLIVLSLTAISYLGYGTRVTADNVTHRTANSAGPPLPYDPAQAPEPIEVIRSTPPSSVDGVLFVTLVCTVTACLFTATCVVCYRVSEWQAQRATLRKLHEGADEEKIEANLGLRAPPGKVLNTRVDGPIQDRVIAPVSPPPIVISPFGWLAPKVNLEARVGGFKPSEGPTLPPHPNAAIPPAPGKVVVFDAAGLAALANPGPVKAGPAAPQPATPPEAPAGS